MTHFRVLFFAFLLAAVTYGRPSSKRSGFTSNLEPIVGYERVTKLVPTPHTKDRLIYGMRFTFGVPLLSGEAEYTRAMDTEDYPETNFSTKDTTDKVKLGLRSSFRLVGFLSAFARAGGQASRNIHEETLSGVHTREEEPIKYKPYAGAGLTARLARNFSFNSGLTVIFHDFPKMDHNDYELTAGFTVKFP